MKKKAGNFLLPSVELTKTFTPESEEELVFAYWVLALLKAGYIDEAYRPEVIEISPSVYFSFAYKKHILDIKIVHKSVYKGDFYIKWNIKAKGILFINKNDRCTVNPSPLTTWGKNNFIFFCYDDNISYVDVKGKFTPSNNIPFSRTQQLCILGNRYVQKVMPLGDKGLFKKSFAPDEYLYTPKLHKKRPFLKSLLEWEKTIKTILILD